MAATRRTAKQELIRDRKFWYSNQNLKPFWRKEANSALDPKSTTEEEIIGKIMIRGNVSTVKSYSDYYLIVIQVAARGPSSITVYLPPCGRQCQGEKKKQTSRYNYEHRKLFFCSIAEVLSISNICAPGYKKQAANKSFTKDSKTVIPSARQTQPHFWSHLWCIQKMIPSNNFNFNTMVSM
jgi:hypothetical protein